MLNPDIAEPLQNHRARRWQGRVHAVARPPPAAIRQETTGAMQVPQKFNFRPNCKSRMLVDVEVTFPECVAGVAGNRNSEHDPEGPSEMAGQRKCGRPRSLHR